MPNDRSLVGSLRENNGCTKNDYKNKLREKFILKILMELIEK